MHVNANMNNETYHYITIIVIRERFCYPPTPTHP